MNNIRKIIAPALDNLYHWMQIILLDLNLLYEKYCVTITEQFLRKINLS